MTSPNFSSILDESPSEVSAPIPPLLSKPKTLLIQNTRTFVNL